MHDLHVLMQLYSTKIYSDLSGVLRKVCWAPAHESFSFGMPLWSRQGFSPLVFSVVCCFSTVDQGRIGAIAGGRKVIWTLPLLSKISYHPAVFPYHPFTLTPDTPHKKHSFSLPLSLSRLQILIKSIKMHFTIAFTLVAIVLAGAASAAPRSPMPVQPVSATSNKRSASTCSANGGVQTCCQNGLNDCVVQGKLPLSEGISWASIFWGTWILSYQPAECVLVTGSKCSNQAHCCSIPNGGIPNFGVIQVVRIR